MVGDAVLLLLVNDWGVVDARQQIVRRCVIDTPNFSLLAKGYQRFVYGEKRYALFKRYW